MESINRISHSLFFVTGAGERKLRQMRRLAVCALLVVSAAGVARFNQSRPRPVQAEQAAALQGEAAVRRLKADGGYASLAAALAAARYQINPAPAKSAQPVAPFYANNPGQRLHATFASDEVRVNATSDKTDGKPDGAELRLQLAGYGYGERLEPLTPGRLTANGDRVEIKKSTIGNHPGPQSAITEWYVNKPEGLEQGFTLTAPPSDSGQGEWLRVALALGAGWRVILRGDQQGALFERQTDGLRLGYDQLQAHDAQGRALPARMALEGGPGLLPDGCTLSLLVDDTQAVYPLTIDPILTQQQKLTASGGAVIGMETAPAQFGTAVALSGDTVVVGASAEAIGARAAQGSAYVFTRSGATWTLQKKLAAADGAANDFFGLSVAVSGDTVVVGALGSDIGGNADQGSAYVFTRSGVIWAQQQKLTANDGAANDFFGTAVALNGDSIVVGAVTDAIGGNADQGSAYVFTRSGVIWAQQQKLTANDGAAGDRFGVSVAISGDTLVVGALFDSIGAKADQGSAYVFARSGIIWAQQQKLTAADGAAGDEFGFSVALSGDTVVVGARLDDIGAKANQGSAYVFARGGATWTLQQKLTADDGAAGDFFGFSVALSGDTVVIGAQGDIIGSNKAQGSAYVFARSDTFWTQQRKLSAGDGSANDEFGFSVALSGDTALVGAPNNLRQGAAYVFVICANNFVRQQQLIASDGVSGDTFGVSVALSGDTLVVGASGDDIGPVANQGSAYVFTRSGAGWTQQQRLTANDGGTDDDFGFSVAISGDTLVVSAVGDDIGANRDQGSAYVFTRSGTVWTQQQKLTSNDGAIIDFFGGSVAVSGDTVVVGAPGDDIGANQAQGSAYVFTRNGAVWTQQLKITAADGAVVDEFGTSVALSGDTLVVGSPLNNIGSSAKRGSAYVFARSGAVWALQQKLIASDDTAFQGFGFSTALSGDTVVVGVLDDNTFTPGSQGAAYVFTRSGTVWTQQQKLIANDGGTHNFFSTSVAVSGDTVVVGAFFDTVAGNAEQGSAYVFTRGDTTWTLQQKLTTNDGAAGDSFGIAVALSGDTVVVGAYRDDIGANGNQGSASVFVCPACPTITLDPATLPGAAMGASYSQTATASGGAGPYQFSLSDGALPPGLSLTKNGQLSGTPTAAGAYRFTITATILSSLCPGSRSYTLNVTSPCPTLTLNPGALPTGQSGAAYSQQLSGSGGAAPYSFALSAGALPNGMSLSSAGLLSGPPTSFGAFNFTARATDANGCQGVRAYSLTITPPCATITVNPNTLPGGAVGAAYSQTITATGGTSPYTFTVSAGALPAFLSLSPSGVLSGAPTTSGAFNITIRATDVNGCQGTRAYTLTIEAPACQFSVAPANHAFSSNGGNGVVSVNTADGCAWTAAPNDSMITIASGANGNGSGTVRFAVSQNPNTGSRRGTLTIAGRQVTVVQAAPVACVSAASFIGNSLAAESIVAAFGIGLARSTEVATTQPLPSTLGGTRVSVLDSLGTERDAPLFFISPTQINFEVPPGTAAGQALVTIIRDGETVAAESLQIVTVSPGLFSANASGQGLVIGFALRVKADGSQSFETVARFDQEQQLFVAEPINLDSATDSVFLILFGTGVRSRSSLGAVSVKIGGVNAEALYAGPQGSFEGLDQLNVLLPHSLAGRGEVELSVIVDGREANKLKVAIK